MEGFQPEHLDLDKLYARLAEKDQELAQAVAIVNGLEEGEERFAWSGQVARVRDSMKDLRDLIELRREYEREQNRID